MCYGWQAQALWSCLLRAKAKPSHQRDYRTATAAANGRNKTPFNEDANLRNATLLLCPRLRPASFLHAQLFFPSRVCSPTYVRTHANSKQHQGHLLNFDFFFFFFSGLQARVFLSRITTCSPPAWHVKQKNAPQRNNWPRLFSPDTVKSCLSLWSDSGFGFRHSKCS